MKGKKLATLWLTPEELKELALLVRRSGLNKSEFLKLPVTESLEKKKKSK
jgi:hypothetical protein